jgi:hypothetical protein
MDGPKSILEERNTKYMAGLDSESRKSKKDKEELELRRSKREDLAQKKRGFNMSSTQDSANPAVTQPMEWIKVNEVFKNHYNLTDLTHLMELVNS